MTDARITLQISGRRQQKIDLAKAEHEVLAEIRAAIPDLLRSAAAGKPMMIRIGVDEPASTRMEQPTEFVWINELVHAVAPEAPRRTICGTKLLNGKTLADQRLFATHPCKKCKAYAASRQGRAQVPALPAARSTHLARRRQ